MNVLVTGGAGYIGSHTVRELLARGHRVVVYDLEPLDPEGPMADAVSVVGDVAETDRLAALMREQAIEGVIHFAGRKFVAEAMRDPGRYFRVNVVGSEGDGAGTTSRPVRLWKPASGRAVVAAETWAPAELTDA